MHNSPGEPWTVERLGTVADLSRSAFARRYTELVGRPPLGHLTWVRMNAAAERLRKTDEPLSTVAQQVGYTSEFAFSSAFRREFGTHPAAIAGRRPQLIRDARGPGAESPPAFRIEKSTASMNWATRRTPRITFNRPVRRWGCSGGRVAAPGRAARSPVAERGRVLVADMTAIPFIPAGRQLDGSGRGTQRSHSLTGLGYRYRREGSTPRGAMGTTFPIRCVVEA
ncbi:helix-turn-helix transcriptional regulator [Streptomyces sp. NPDC102274]|uniref:helix-turn-helix transcriptional regulator n=1 Tax=Streptomyces sp. NPDC102274 TaxID=3366151 RepID=UPI0037FCF2FF